MPQQRWAENVVHTTLAFHKGPPCRVMLFGNGQTRWRFIVLLFCLARRDLLFIDVVATDETQNIEGSGGCSCKYGAVCVGTSDDEDSPCICKFDCSKR